MLHAVEVLVSQGKKSSTLGRVVSAVVVNCAAAVVGIEYVCPFPGTLYKTVNFRFWPFLEYSIQNKYTNLLAPSSIQSNPPTVCHYPFP